jgi:hypothetical protein
VIFWILEINKSAEMRSQIEFKFLNSIESLLDVYAYELLFQFGINITHVSCSNITIFNNISKFILNCKFKNEVRTRTTNDPNKHEKVPQN